MNTIPPVPPPVGGGRGGPPFPNVGMGNAGRAPPAAPQIRPGGAPPPPGPPGPPGPPRPPAISSIQYSDITPQKRMDEKDCKKALTTYESYILRKQTPSDPKKDKATWAKAEIIKETLSQDEIVKQVKKLDEKSEKSKKSVSDKKRELAPYMQGQLSRLLDGIRNGETDRNFEWSLAQLDRKEKPLKNGKHQWETTTMSVYVKRCPTNDVNAVVIWEAIERNKRQRMEAIAKPHPPPGAAPPAGAVVLPPKGKDRRGRKKYHGDSSSDSSFSDSDTDSSYSDSISTSISSRSRGSRRYKHGHRGRSFSRHRDHRRYAIADRPYSPVAYGHTTRYLVPDVPRAAGYDPVAVAYEAGRVDREAEIGYPRIGQKAILHQPFEDPYIRRHSVADEYIDARAPRIYEPRSRRGTPSSYSDGWY